MAIRIRQFRGMQPKLHPTLLQPGIATVCENAAIRDGALAPISSPAVQSGVSIPHNMVRVFLFDGVWLSYDSAAVSVVQGPVAEDRIYVSGDGPPRVEKNHSTSLVSYSLALPPPNTQPTRSVLSGSSNPDNREQIVFAFTWVTILGEESQPSPLSAPVFYTPGQVIRVQWAGSTPPAMRGVTHRRIYRSVTDAAGVASLFFVGQVALAVSQFDYSEAVSIAEPLATMDYDQPPANISGFTAMPNGMIAGFVGRELMFCEPYRPHAWPVKYRLLCDAPIVGLSAFGSTLAIMTRGTPYIAQGSHPDSVVMAKMEQYLPCVSARSIVDMGYSCAYASRDGLVVLSESGAQVVTRNLFTRKQWLQLRPSGFVAAQYEGRYHFLHNPAGGDRVMGIIDLTGETPDYLRVETTAADLYYDPDGTNLFMLDAKVGVSTDPLQVRIYDPLGSSPLTYTWRSGRMTSGNAVNFPWARVDRDAGGGTVTVNVYGNGGTLIHSFTTANEPVRMPGGRLDDTFEIEIIGTARVFNVGMGFNIEELAG